MKNGEVKTIEEWMTELYTDPVSFPPCFQGMDKGAHLLMKRLYYVYEINADRFKGVGEGQKIKIYVGDYFVSIAYLSRCYNKLCDYFFAWKDAPFYAFQAARLTWLKADVSFNLTYTDSEVIRENSFEILKKNKTYTDQKRIF